MFTVNNDCHSFTGMEFAMQIFLFQRLNHTLTHSYTIFSFLTLESRKERATLMFKKELLPLSSVSIRPTHILSKRFFYIIMNFPVLFRSSYSAWNFTDVFFFVTLVNWVATSAQKQNTDLLFLKKNVFLYTILCKCLCKHKLR